MNLETRLAKLESHIEQKTFAILSYRQGYETLVEAKERFKETNGFELPDHATIICYQRIDTAKVKIQ